MMAEQKSGVILNISSMNAFRPLTRIAAYSAAKAGVSNFTQWLAVHMAQEYSPEIRVNAIAPGFFLTEQNRFLLTDKNTGELTATRQIHPQPHPHGPLWHSGRSDRHGPMAAFAGLGFRHRYRCPGGWRVFRFQWSVTAMLIGKGFSDRILTDDETSALVGEALSTLPVDGKRVLIIIPDGTRSMPMPFMFGLFDQFLGPRVSALDYLVALGTHQPMNDAQLSRLVGRQVVNGLAGEQSYLQSQVE